MRILLRLLHTLKPLRWRQWWYRGWHPIVKRLSRPAAPTAPSAERALPGLVVWPVVNYYDPEQASFTFLNRTHRFDDCIDWEYAAEGPLWKFNLHYFEWLYDEELSVADRLETIGWFCAATSPGKSMHGYPTSLRIMAWIWLDLKHVGLTGDQRGRLHQDADWLRRFPEYHLDGNHLFENAIALSTAGCYFGDQRMLAAGISLLERCTQDQLYKDGGHCEGSPMYHSLILWRQMQAMEICDGLAAPGKLRFLLRKNVVNMLGWLKAMTFSDGTWPAVNDAVAGIAPEPSTFFSRAAALRIDIPEVNLEDCGYRMIRMPEFELFIDVDGVRPAWQPGHAHADTGNFCLQVRGRAVIVDTGCSTYEDRRIRAAQRGTAAHNTLRVDGRDSSEMWSRFRVGRRCRVLTLHELPGSLHIGYRDASGNRLRRSFSWSDSGIEIRDQRSGAGRGFETALHIAPGLALEEMRISNLLRIDFEGVDETVTKTTEIAAGFNIVSSSACLLLIGAENDSLIRFTLIPK